LQESERFRCEEIECNQPVVDEEALAFGVSRTGSSAMLSFVSQPLPLDQAVEALKLDPTHAVRARVDDLTVEIRAVPEGPTRPLAPGEKSAADVFREIGPWEGETLDELLAFFAEARRRCGNRNVRGL
jgi:hypothetical protein